MSDEKPVSYIQSNSVPFDPPIVDSTAELDQILSAPHVKVAARRVRSPYSEQSTSSSSEPDTPDPTSSKPKLSDALSHLTFSPKRPRSPALQPRSAAPARVHGLIPGGPSTSNQPASQHPPRPHRETTRSSSLRVSHVDARESEPTPRARKVHLLPQSIASDNALRPPTPSAADSNFTRLAKGLASEIEAEQSRWHTPLEVEDIHAGAKESRPTQIVRERKAIPSKHRPLRHYCGPLTERYCKRLRMLPLRT